MSPFSQLLHDLRVRHGLRQAELADRIGYEQSYISALEVGLKGPPTMEFLDRVANAMSLTDEDRYQLWVAAQASQRKFVISSDAPPDIYWMFNDLRSEMDQLTPVQVRMIREVIAMRSAMSESREPEHRLKRRRKEEAPM
jgi:transcriptional regulator with XRE-family HTH domain